MPDAGPVVEIVPSAGERRDDGPASPSTPGRRRPGESPDEIVTRLPRGHEGDPGHRPRVAEQFLSARRRGRRGVPSGRSSPTPSSATRSAAATVDACTLSRRQRATTPAAPGSARWLGRSHAARSRWSLEDGEWRIDAAARRPDRARSRGSTTRYRRASLYFFDPTGADPGPRAGVRARGATSSPPRWSAGCSPVRPSGWPGVARSATSRGAAAGRPLGADQRRRARPRST